MPGPIPLQTFFNIVLIAGFRTSAVNGFQIINYLIEHPSILVNIGIQQVAYSIGGLPTGNDPTPTGLLFPFIANTQLAQKFIQMPIAAST